jgi:uncharacterized protein YukE
MKYALMKERDFIKIIFSIQVSLNNSVNASIDLSSNEVLYEFKVKKSLNLLRIDDENSFTSLKKNRITLRKKIEKTIVFVNASMKIRYDSKWFQFNLKFENSVYLKLHKEYNQSDLTNKKFAKQRLESIKIVEKINKLIYKFEISQSWKIHSVISMIYLKSASIENDFYEREADESESVKDAQNSIKNIYEMKKILIKRSIKKRWSRKSKIQYKVKWLRWDDHHNQWMNTTDMKNVKNIVNEFERKLISRDDNEQWLGWP